MNTEIIVFIILICWFCIHVIYIFKRQLLGKLGKWLHRWGWVNEWSMYTGWKADNDWYQILYKDYTSDENGYEWKPVNTKQFTFPKIILNPNMRLKLFLSLCITKIYAGKRTNEPHSVNQEVFDYLCSVVVQLPNLTNAKYRKVKLERHIKGIERTTQISSTLFEIK